MTETRQLSSPSRSPAKHTSSQAPASNYEDTTLKSTTKALSFVRNAEVDPKVGASVSSSPVTSSYASFAQAQAQQQQQQRRFDEGSVKYVPRLDSDGTDDSPG